MTKTEAHDLLDAARGGAEFTLGAINKALMATGDFRRPRKDNWRPEEDELLTELWPLMGIACASHFPGRSEKAVETHAHDALKLNMIPRWVRSAQEVLPTVDNYIEHVEHVEAEKVKPRKPALPRKDSTPFGFVPTGAARSVFELARCA
jgi:hypothetical protein